MYWIFRSILVLIHVIYSLLVEADKHYHNFWKIVNKLWYGKHVDMSTMDFEMCLQKMRKPIKHIIIIYEHREEEYKNLLRLLHWSVTLQIPYISFYDREGKLQKDREYIKSLCEKHKPIVTSKVSWNNGDTPIIKTQPNGSKPKSVISFFSYKDGKEEILLLTQTLAKAVTLGMLKQDDITEELLSEKLSLLGLPDPDLAVIHGPIYSTYGLLPWHTRTTEFLSLPNYNDLEPIHFFHLLKKYDNCEQRYGK